MTEEERAEAERLAPECFGDEMAQLFIDGYAAACDAKRDMFVRTFEKLGNCLEIERARSAKLFEALDLIKTLTYPNILDDTGAVVFKSSTYEMLAHKCACSAIAEYEAANTPPQD